MSNAILERGSVVGFRVVSREVNLYSREAIEFIDVTAEVEAAVEESGLRDGIAVVFSSHTTAGIVINEAEPLLLGDLRRLLEQFAPRDGAYQHDDLSIRTVNLEPNERANGHSHCQRLLIGASESIPIVAGRLQLGKWQRVFFAELDGPRPRAVRVQLMGI
jgi:secondary thiamine-phosphate synthase enzyme